MKCYNEAFEVINDLRKKICDCRLGVSYISNPYDPLDDYPKSDEQKYNDGYKSGLYDGLEMALGLLERVEETMEGFYR